MFVQYQLLGVPDGGQLFVLLYCANAELSGRHYENRSTFFFPVPRDKEKKIYFEMLILDLGNRLVKIVCIDGN